MQIIKIYLFLKSNENSPYLLKHSPESINSPFFTRKPAFNGKIETIEKFEGNFNSSQNSPVESAGLKLTFDLSKDVFNYPGETKSNSNTPLHQDASQKRQIGQKKSSFNKQCSAAKSNLEKMEFDFKQN